MKKPRRDRKFWETGGRAWYKGKGEITPASIPKSTFDIFVVKKRHMEIFSILLRKWLFHASLKLIVLLAVAGLKLTPFYDSGCGELVVSKEATEKLKEFGRAKQEFSGPIVSY